MEFYGPDRLTTESPWKGSDRYSVIGETIEVSASLYRPILLHLDEGLIALPSVRDPNTPIIINSSIDALVSCAVLYESWVERLMSFGEEYEECDAALARAKAEIARLDTVEADGAYLWWPSKLDDVGRLL